METWMLWMWLIGLYFTALHCLTVPMNIAPGQSTPCEILIGGLVNCSHRSLSKVENNTLPHTALSIDFSFNDVQNISGFTFYPFKQLVWLDLSYNFIDKLDCYAFMNLSNLKFLNLNSNKLLLTPPTYPIDLFQPLVNLEIFHVEDNPCNKHAKYKAFPNAMAALTNLREFYTDFSPYMYFEKQFSAMTKLEILSSSGFGLPNKRNHKCCVSEVFSYTFEPFTNVNISQFRLAGSCLKQLHIDAFLPLQSVKLLDLSGNKNLGLNKTLASLRPLQNKTITHLDVSGCNDFSTRKYRDVALTNTVLRYLQTMCVEFLDMSSNYIVFFTTFHLSRPDCLRELNLSGHISKVHVLWHTITKFFHHLFSLNISSLAGPTKNIHNQEVSAVEGAILPQLVTLDMSFLPMSCGFTSDQFLTVSYANISGWNCSFFESGYVFVKMDNVTQLTMRKTNLAEGLSTYRFNKSIFAKMLLLQYLDLSDNQLTFLPENLILSNNNLSSIILSNNKLSAIPDHFLKDTSVQYLDISVNVIQWLTVEAIASLEIHKDKHKEFSVILGNNPFVCSCTSVHFLEWLNRTLIVADFGDSFMCRFPNGSLVRIVDVMAHLKEFTVSCISKFWLTVAIAVSLVVIPIIICVLGYYRHRWNIHYWFYTQCKPTEDMLEEQTYNYDVFVAYNHNDRAWVHYSLREFMEAPERGIHLCLHHRDFEAGQAIQQNIVDSVNNSRKVLLVISRQFVSSSWGEYEIEMAGMRSVQEARSNVIICVLLEEIPIGEMPRTLMNLWQRVTFLVWPESVQERNLFWERLYNVVK